MFPLSRLSCVIFALSTLVISPHVPSPICYACLVFLIYFLVSIAGCVISMAIWYSKFRSFSYIRNDVDWILLRPVMVHWLMIQSTAKSNGNGERLLLRFIYCFIPLVMLMGSVSCPICSMRLFNERFLYMFP